MAFVFAKPLDQTLQVLRHGLTKLAARFLALGAVRENPVFRGLVPVAKLVGQRLIPRRVMALHLGQETLDRHPHQSGPAKRGHRAEHMRRIRALLTTVQFQQVAQTSGHILPHMARQVVFLKEALVALQRARRKTPTVQRKVQRVAHTPLSNR